MLLHIWHLKLSDVTHSLMGLQLIYMIVMWNIPWAMDLPNFFLDHSLRTELVAIQLIASGICDIGVGLMSYNNFGFSNTISVIKGFEEGEGLQRK